MKANYALVLLLIGFLCCIVGALMKIMHYPGADALLLTGLGCEGVGVIMLLVRLLR